MNISEFNKVLGAVIVLAVIWSVVPIISNNVKLVPTILLFSVIIVFATVFAKKLMAHLFDADVEHDIWRLQRYWYYPKAHLPKAVPMGIILPIFFSIFTLGLIKVSTFLTYEARAKSSRKSRRFGYYSFAEMTDWHNGIIGSAGVICALAIGAISYFLPTNAELLTKMAIYYAFWNLIPASNLDGSQIFFGSRTLWAILATITIILTALALII